MFESSHGQAPAEPFPEFQQQLRKTAAYSADPCGEPGPAENDGTPEASIFDIAKKAALYALNASEPADPASARIRADKILKMLERESAEVNASWPEENRLHFEVIKDVEPALVLTMSFRTQARYVAFGVPETESAGKPNHQWQEIGEDDQAYQRPFPRLWMSLYPLHRGPAGNPRFLAAVNASGCAGSYGVTYDVRQWDPHGVIGFEQIIKQEGAFGLDEGTDGKGPTKDEPFAPVGKLETDGVVITLPYCWFSVIDWWDNPSLCAVDSYDLSGDKVRFRSRTFNQPDIVAIAKALEYAEKRDLPAVLGYCASEAVARKLVRQTTSVSGDAENPRVTRLPGRRERVEFEDAGTRFDLEERRGRWVIVSFAEE